MPDAGSARSSIGVDLAVIFSPKHGLGVSAAGGDAIDEIPDGLDLLLFEIPDMGARCNTHILTLSHVMEVCAKIGLLLLVLDRPSLLGGDLTAIDID